MTNMKKTKSKGRVTAAVLVLAMLLVFAVPAYAFEFPEPDWGALLRERENMVSQTDFALYAEGDVQSAPYYGAKFEPRGGTYIGMITEASEEYAPLGSYLTYIDNMNQGDLYSPAKQMIENGNSVVMVGWTINDLDSVDYGRVRSVLETLNSYGKPMFIRFANEMNESAIGADPTKYVDVFRRVADMVHEYPNLAVVWSPADIGALDRPFEYFYPGDSYVDWVGISSYSMVYFLGNPNTSRKESVYFMTGDYAWATNKVKPLFDFMSRNNINKPVMISEGGVATNLNSGPVSEGWAAPRLRDFMWNLVMKYPQIKMINYFNTHRGEEASRYDIDNYPYAKNIYKEAAEEGPYIRRAEGNGPYVFQPANNAGTLSAKDGIVKLYTLAHFPGAPDVTVNYYIDGNWTHSANQIPYKFNMDIRNLADGAHTLKIAAGGREAEYTLYKRGGAVRFGAEPDYVPAQSEIEVKLNGSKISFDSEPIMEDDRVLVPMRAIFEALGAEVFWDDTRRTASAYRYGIYIEVPIDMHYMMINGNLEMLDVPARLVGDRTLVPARAISEAFGCTVTWDNDTQTVLINT